MKHILYTLFILIFTACSSKPPAPVQTISSTHSSTVKKLYRHYNQWRGTPYRYGGLSQNGVDCSGFTYQCYKSLFNCDLPRSTQYQIKEGKRVYLGELEAGDLIFFKTGEKKRHVGIYIEEGKFMHASSSRGVTISNLKNDYWKKCYWQAKRLF